VRRVVSRTGGGIAPTESTVGSAAGQCVRSGCPSRLDRASTGVSPLALPPAIADSTLDEMHTPFASMARLVELNKFSRLESCCGAPRLHRPRCSLLSRRGRRACGRPHWRVSARPSEYYGERIRPPPSSLLRRAFSRCPGAHRACGAPPTARHSGRTPGTPWFRRAGDFPQTRGV